MRGVSVILCCYNSVLRLPSTLVHLSRQITQNASWEIILVDNGSTDGTSECAKRTWESYSITGVPFILIQEETPGLSFARMAGVHAASYDYLIFCDDDNWLESDYVERAFELMSLDKRIGIMGGLNTAVSDVNLPVWFHEMQLAYACGPQAAQDGEVPRQYITGAGMIIRKEIFTTLQSLGFKSQLTDRKGEELSSGGDSEICFIASMLGFKLIYSSELRLQHYMGESRINWPYFVKMTLEHAKASYKLQYYLSEQNGIDTNLNWLNQLFRLTRKNIHRGSFRLMYDFFKCQKIVSGLPAVLNMMEVEKWLTHFKSYSSYTIMLEFIKSLKTSIATYVKQPRH